ncbi:MAG: aromatic ring-hydroxylating dioxygenase subunit alpha [Chloroflexota bacterium]
MTKKTLRTWPTFPSDYYFDQTRHEQELAQIWYRNWLYLCRATTLQQPKTYRTFSIGNQNIIVLRDEVGEVQAFHNACRHRGSILCTATQGEFNTRSIVCPYHNWSYSLQGMLKGVPFIGSPDKLGRDDLSLYPVPVREWGGCIFINLDKTADSTSFTASFDPHIDALANWPLADLTVGYTFTVDLACNWKIFWENFQECYHCPGIHPELCDMVPLYKKAVSGRAAARELAALNSDTEDIPQVGLREGAATWSMDGKIHGRPFHNLTEEEKRIGYKYLVGLPNWFIAAHPDYIRLVSLFPTSAETMQLKAEWLFPQDTLDHPNFDLTNVVNFGKLVLEQDGAVCELNQRGLRSQQHKQGLLLPRAISYSEEKRSEGEKRSKLAKTGEKP